MASVTRSNLESVLERESSYPYEVFSRCVNDKYDKFFSLTGAAAEALGASRLAAACGEGENFLGYNQLFTDAGSLVNKVSELCEEEGDSVQKIRQVGGLVGAAADATITSLSVVRFTAENMQSEAFQGPAIQVGVDVANIVSCASSIVEASLEIAEVATREQEPRTNYEVEVDEMIKQKSIWDLVKNIASMTGSGLGIIGAITAIVLSSWVTLGISLIVFIGAIASFFVEDQLERFKQDHEIDEIMASLTKKR